MNQSEKILEIKDLCVEFQTVEGTVKAINHLNYTLHKGEKLGIVGESGSGKSVSSLGIMQLIPNPPGKIVAGEILYKGQDLVKTSEKDMQKIRGNEISMIFQEPMTSLNPVFRIGEQVDEIVALHNPTMSKEEVKARTIEMLKLVGIANSDGVYRMYPHELSGGMRQRICIAIGLACNPRLIIADEPTTALDVTIQAQILDLMRNLKDKINSSIMLITHDLGVIASMCDEIIVMYGGRVCERGTADDIFYRPCHEYTKGLLRSIPRKDNMNERLVPIGGTPINLLNMPKGCAFCPRCEAAMKICLDEVPQEIRMSDTHLASCWMNVKKMYEAQEENKNE